MNSSISFEVTDELVKVIRECVENALEFDFINYTIRNRLKELQEHPEQIPQHAVSLDPENVISIMDLIGKETKKFVDDFIYKFTQQNEAVNAEQSDHADQ